MVDKRPGSAAGMTDYLEKMQLRLKKHLPALIVCLVLLVSVASPTAVPAITRPVPFLPGEKLHFRLRWGAIPVGEAVMAVEAITDVEGTPAYHFVLTAHTFPFIDMFYKVRDRIDAYLDVGINRSVFYAKKQHEGSTRRSVVVKFDWDKHEVQYSNYGKKKAPVAVPAGTMDPLSSFYYARVYGLRVNDDIQRPVTDGKKCVVGRARVIRKEAVTISGKTYDTYLVEPEAKDIGGVFKQSKNARVRVWLTADHRRIPVKIKSKVVVGSFTVELVSATGLKPKS